MHATGSDPSPPEARPAPGPSTVRVPDTPWAPAVVALAAAVVLVIARVERIGHGDLSTFVVAGSRSVARTAAPPGLAVQPGAGYDGQFYYRLALAPWDLAHTAFGVTIDSPLRVQRIGYPTLAWALSLGNRGWVPTTLVVVNVLALGLLAFFCGLWARSLGRHALWGLLPAAYFGLEYSLARDLTEITAVCLLVAGIVAIRSERPLLGALALSGAVLCRETALVVVAALLLVRAFEVLRRRARPARIDWAWIAPLGAFGAWQVVVRLGTGVFPLTGDRGVSLSPPFVAIVRLIGDLGHASTRLQALEAASFVCLGVTVVLAALSLGRTTASAFEQVAFCLALLLTVCLSSNVWDTDPNEFRTFVEVWVLGCGVLLGARHRNLTVPAALTGMTWLLVAAWEVTSL